MNTEKRGDLKRFRMHAGISQKDMAYLLDMAAPNLNRYEHGTFTPPLTIILAYHILFGCSLTEMFRLSSTDLREQLLKRSKELCANNYPSPKSKYRIGCLEAIVKRLSHAPSHD